MTDVLTLGRDADREQCPAGKRRTMGIDGRRHAEVPNERARRQRLGLLRTGRNDGRQRKVPDIGRQNERRPGEPAATVKPEGSARSAT
jgi:hypothetical protein